MHAHKFTGALLDTCKESAQVRRMDKRRKQTRLRLHAALRDLLGEMPLPRITVEALAKRAGVTRPTFYSNYPDLTAMLEEYLDQLLRGMEDHHTTLLRTVPPENRHDKLADHVQTMLDGIDPADTRLRALLEGVPSLAVERKMTELVERMMTEAEKDTSLPMPPEARKIKAHFTTGAFLGALRLYTSGPSAPRADVIARGFAHLMLYEATCGPQDTDTPS